MSSEEYVTILNHLDTLVLKIQDSEIYLNYIKHTKAINDNKETQHLIAQFNQLKEEFNEVSRFGKYHPDYSRKRRELNQFKKRLDLRNDVMEYRRAEYQLQSLLDEVLYESSIQISPHINVVSNNPFFQTKSNGGCSTGSSCSCKSVS